MALGFEMPLGFVMVLDFEMTLGSGWMLRLARISGRGVKEGTGEEKSWVWPGCPGMTLDSRMTLGSEMILDFEMTLGFEMVLDFEMTLGSRWVLDG